MAAHRGGVATPRRTPPSTVELETAPEADLHYQPHPAQACAPDRRIAGFHPVQAYHMDRYKVPYRAIHAGTGGGKSFAGTFEDLMWCLENPGNVAATWEPTFPMVNKIFYPTVRKLLGTSIFYSKVVSHWSRSEHYIEFVNDSILWLGSLEDPTRAEGQNLDRGRIDEARLVKRLGGEDGALMVVDRRLRGSTPGNPTSMDVTTSAPTKDLYDFFENPAMKRPGARVYRWASEDNPHLQKRYRELMASYSGAAYKRFVLGEYARAEGLVYENYDPESHIKPDPVGQIIDHVTVGVDLGWGHPSCLLVLTWTGSSVHATDESYGSHRGIDEIVHEAKRLNDSWDAKGISSRFWVGPDARRPEYVKRFRDEGLDVQEYDAKVQEGIDIVQDKFKGRDLTIGRGCPNLLRELDTYSWKPGQKKDVPEDVGNDACDALRYGVCGGPPEEAKVLRGSRRLDGQGLRAARFRRG